MDFVNKERNLKFFFDNLKKAETLPITATFAEISKAMEMEG